MHEKHDTTRRSEGLSRYDEAWGSLQHMQLWRIGNMEVSVNGGFPMAGWFISWTIHL